MAETTITTRRKILKLSGAALCGPLALPFVATMPAVAGGVDLDADLLALIDDHDRVMGVYCDAIEAADIARFADAPDDVRFPLMEAYNEAQEVVDEYWSRLYATPARTTKGVLAKLRLEGQLTNLQTNVPLVAAAMSDLEAIVGGAA